MRRAIKHRMSRYIVFMGGKQSFIHVGYLNRGIIEGWVDRLQVNERLNAMVMDLEDDSGWHIFTDKEGRDWTFKKI